MAGGQTGAGEDGPVARAYADLVDRGALTPDPAQYEAVRLLDTIAGALGGKAGNGRGPGGVFKRKTPIRGAYLWGDVGRGKTQLMDLFYSAVPIANKRRAHFHGFMDDVHEAIKRFRTGTKPGKGRRDPVPEVARQVGGSLRLLCLDEFHVDDITNAMLLDRLFGTLFDNGLVLVATSNVAPEMLYRNGLNRQLFVPFIDRLNSVTTVYELKAARDYRLEKLAGLNVFHFGEGPGPRLAMDRLWAALTDDEPGTPGTVFSLGRQIAVPCQALGVARFGFGDICGVALGARDFLRIAEAYHTIMIDDVPQFGHLRSDQAKRFILLIDTLYDQSVKLAASFAVPLDDLEQDSKTAFEFARTKSRLVEMQSAAYLGAPHRSFAQSAIGLSPSR